MKLRRLEEGTFLFWKQTCCRYIVLSILLSGFVIQRYWLQSILSIATETASWNRSGFCISRFLENFIKICEIGGSQYSRINDVSPASLLFKWLNSVYLVFNNFTKFYRKLIKFFRYFMNFRIYVHRFILYLKQWGQ